MKDWDTCKVCGHKLSPMPYPGVGGYWCTNCHTTYTASIVTTDSTNEERNKNESSGNKRSRV